MTSAFNVKADSDIVVRQMHFRSDKLTCCVSVCRNYQNPASIIDLYPLPEEETHRQLWCEAFNIPDNIAKLPDTRVCALHFRSKIGLPPLQGSQLTLPDIPYNKSADGIFTCLVSNDDSQVILGTSNTEPSLYHQSIPEEEQFDFTTFDSILETVLSEDSEEPNVLNSDPDTQNNITEQLLTEPEIPILLDSKLEVPNSSAEPCAKPPSENNLQCNEAVENQSADSSNMFLALECEEEPLSSTQQSIYMKDLMDFMSANEIVYRLAHSPFSPKFPSVEKTNNEIDDKIQDNSTIPYYLENANLQISRDNVSLSTLKPLNNLSTNVLPKSFVLPSFMKLGNNNTVSQSPSHKVPVSLPSSVTDVTGKYSLVRDGNGQILNQNYSSNLSIDGNVVFSKSLTLNSSNSVLVSQPPSRHFLLTPKGLLSPASRPLVQNVNSACDSSKYSSSKNVILNTVSVLANNIGSNSGASVSSSPLGVPQIQFLTPISSVQKFFSVNTQPINVSSSQQCKTTALLSSIISHPVNTPSASLSSTPTYSITKNPSEFVHLVNTSSRDPLPVSSLNSSKEVLSNVQGQLGLNPASSSSFTIMKMTENPRLLSSSSGNFTSSGNAIPVSLQRVAPNSKIRPRATVINPALVEEILPSVPKGTDCNDQRLLDAPDSCDSPPPVVPVVEYKSDEDESEEEVPVEPIPNIPVIVDVISAREGASEFFTEDKIPEILFDKSKKMPSETQRKDSPHRSDNLQNSQVDNIIKVDSQQKDSGSQFICFKSSYGDILVSKLHSIFALQKEIPTLHSGNESISDIRRIFSIKSGSLKNRLDDADNLRKRLKEEKMVSISAFWMLQKKYFPKVSPCNVCGHSVLALDRHERFQDRFCYTCKNCNTQIPLKRPTFFERFKNFSLEHILLLTYHWACMSSLQEILTDIDLKVEDILRYFKALQQLCRDINIKKGLLGICPKSLVEAAVVKLGNFYVLGAFDRKTANTRLEALSEEEAFESMHPIKLLSRWLYTNSTLVSEQQIPAGIIPGIKTKAADSDTTILSIQVYLNTGLGRMFERLDHQKLSKEFINGFLSERQWRDKYGRTVELAFWNVMLQIKDLNVSEISNGHAASVINGKVYTSPYINPKKSYGFEMRWGPFSTVNRGADPIPPKPAVVPSVRVNNFFPASVNTNYPASVNTNYPASVNTNYPASVNTNYPASVNTSSPANMNTNYPASVNTSSPANMNTNYPARVNKISFEPVKKHEPKKKKSLLKYMTPSFYNAASYFLDIPEIPGSNLYLTSKALLAIKIRFDESDHDANAYNVDAIGLGLRLRKEGFISSPVRWLVKKGYIKSSSPCYVCSATAFLRDNPKFSDGCSWSCQSKKCQFENVFKRPKFFARFPQQPMAHISAMIFHWTVQSDTAIITSDAPLDIVKISAAWRAFQLLCCAALKRDKRKIGGENLVVEVALVQFGKKYILGAMDRNSRLTFLKAFIGSIFVLDSLSNTLLSWIYPGSVVVINADKKLQLPSEFQVAFADCNVTDKNDSSLHVLNITSYLLNHVSFMFGHLRPDVIRTEAIQVSLDELMWRERNGRKPHLAFAKIMQEIFYTEGATKCYEIPVEEIEEDNTIKLKEARVVLRRIPKTVLKYYNCLPPDSSTDKALLPSSDGLTHPISSEETCASLENLAPCNNSTETYSGNMTPTLVRKCRDEDEYVIVDEDEESTSDSYDSDSTIFRVVKQNVPKNSKGGPRRKYSKFPPKSSNVEATASCPAGSKKSLTHSVQPLVINVCRKNKKPTFYIKSESSTTSNENSIDSLVCDGNVEESQGQTAVDSSNSTESSNFKFCTAPPVNVKKIKTEICEPSSNKLEKRIDTKHECIECGETVSMDHFRKNFFCTDCKNNVYTTCCSNAFFAHRSSLLFGKRMPRRFKEHNKGLHKSIRLSHPWYCSCGFKTVHGNHLASHMVKCEKTTCYLSNR